MGKIHRQTESLYELDPQQQDALTMLLSGHTVTETAAALGVTRETVSRWKHRSAAFMAAYNDARIAAYQADRQRLADLRQRAYTRLSDLLEAKDETVALRAAVAIVKIDLPDAVKGETDPEKVALFSW